MYFYMYRQLGIPAIYIYSVYIHPHTRAIPLRLGPRQITVVATHGFPPRLVIQKDMAAILPLRKTWLWVYMSHYPHPHDRDSSETIINIPHPSSVSLQSDTTGRGEILFYQTIIYSVTKRQRVQSPSCKMSVAVWRHRRDVMEII